jgi:hypothetical protein
MAFTTKALAEEINKMNIDTWISSTPVDQNKFIPAFRLAFATLQAWIIENGGEDNFGWDHVLGLTYENGKQVELKGPQGKAPFNDAFNDVRAFLDSPKFSLSQAASGFKRLVSVLNKMG